jgi:hypothetical protein
MVRKLHEFCIIDSPKNGDLYAKLFVPQQTNAIRLAQNISQTPIDIAEQPGDVPPPLVG